MIAAVLVLVVGGVLLSALASRWRRLERAFPEPPHDQRGVDEPQVGPAHLRAEVVFATATDGVARLDLVVCGGEARGWPFDLPVCLPIGTPWSAAAERTLARWADEQASVDLSVLDRGNHPLVQISDGSTTVRLEPGHPGELLGE